MKKLFLIAGIACLCLTGCKSKKQVVYQAPQSGRVEIEIPCKETGFDDAEYFRGTGTATSPNQQSARDAALGAAKAIINGKLGGFVQGLSAGYSTAVAGQSASDKVQRLMEKEMNQVVEHMLNDAEQICEKLYQLPKDGQYESWISIQIPKKEMVDNMEKAISDNEELEIYFKRNEFRKYAEDKIKELKDARKEATGK